MIHFLTTLWFKAWMQIGRLFHPDRRHALFIEMTGPPGSGKDTMADLLSKSIGLPPLSSGAVIRWHIANKTDFGRRWEQQVSDGMFIPDAAITDLIIGELDKPAYSKGAILNGFPRTLQQARKLRSALAVRGNQVDIAVYLQVSKQDITERLALRRICSDPDCGRTYHLRFSPPKQEGKCDNDKCNHAALIQRTDDRPEQIAVRLDEFNRTFEPMRRYYEKLGLLVTIESTNEMGIDKVFEQVLFAVDEVE